MAKVKVYNIDPREKYKIIEEFFEIIAGLKNKKEVIDFFVGILTPSESLMMARRIQIAKMIINENSYEDIRKKLKVGFSTIQKTDKWINNEDRDYNLWIKKCIIRNIKKRKDGRKNGDFSSLLKKYPQHRMFQDLFS